MRLMSLDVFRGVAIASMVLVNNPGSWSAVYPLLQHAEWNGCTPADLVFPFFLFISGVAMAFSLSKWSYDNRPQLEPLPGEIYVKIAYRCVLLFLFGLLLNGFPNYDWTSLRIMGVLQRISLAYLFAAIAVLHLPRKALWILSITILTGYWLALSFIPVPGYGMGNLTPEGNLSAYLDRLILTPAHLWKQGQYDPEGLFSTLPAVITVITGYLTGEFLRHQPVISRTSVSLVLAGLSSLVVGLLWSAIFPLNKTLWTSSFVLVTTGWALLFLALCYETLEVRGWRRWGWPFEVMGLNSIFVFIASGFAARLLIYTEVGEVNTKTWLYDSFFQSWAGPMNGSLAFAIATVFVWWVILYGMYRQRWFFKL